MTRLITHVVVIALVAVTAIAVLPMSVHAQTTDPSTPIDTLSSNAPPTEPPLPSPPIDPPHIPITYTVGWYLSKQLVPNPDGTLRQMEAKTVEDLAYITNKLHLTNDEIKYSNPSVDVSTLKEGDTLTVPPVHGIVYKIQAGDALTWIAYSYQVDVNTIVSYNSIADPDSISPDQVIIIPGAKLPPLPPPTPVYTPVSNSGTYAAPTKPTPYVGSNHFYFGFCTWYVANRRPIPWFGDAIQWWPNARAYGYSEGSTPRPGAIVVESPNHVAYVESVGANSFVVSEANWNAWDVIDYRTIQDSDPAIVGFIY